MSFKDVFDNIAYIINAEIFYKEAHALIWKACEALAEDAEPIDILTVTNKLKEQKKLDNVGGPYYITQLTNKVASPAHAEHHSAILYQLYVQREMVRKAGELVQVAYDDDFDQAQAVYSKNTTYLDQILAGKRADKNMRLILSDHQKEMERRRELSKAGGITGVPTGSHDLDKNTSGWQGNDLVIIAGRPGMGKTAVSLNLFAKKAAERKKHVLFFSLEMDDLSLADRLICSYGGIDSDHLKSGKLTQDEWMAYSNASNELLKLPFYIDDTAKVDVKHIRSIARTKARKNECDMIVIDYLQLIDTPQDNYGFKNREREVAEISRALKVLAKEIGKPILLLCQLSRNVEHRGGDKKPVLADLRESGAIEQDADKVIFTYRPAYYGITEDNDGTPLENLLFLVFAKHRSGKLGEIILKHSDDMTRFFDYDHYAEKELLNS